MALSNWDTLAFDKRGDSTNGIFEAGKIKVRIYKNWLYVNDPKAWEEKGCFIEDTVMEVMKGEFIYKPIHIIAKRGRQSSILCVVWTCNYEKEASERYNIMAGCGVYGYRGDDWVGVESETFNELDKFYRKVIAEHLCDDSIVFPTAPLRFNQGDGFFINNGIGDMESSATPVGQSKVPIFEQMLGE